MQKERFHNLKPWERHSCHLAWNPGKTWKLGNFEKNLEKPGGNLIRKEIGFHIKA